MSLALSSVLKRFAGRAAVDGVTADIPTGAFFAVLGPSGCGKSTLLRLIAGLERLDAGAVTLAGRAVAGPGLHVAPEDRRVGVVFQSYALWPHMSVRDNVAFAAESRGRSRAEARAEADRRLETVALTGLAERKPAALSGGQRQRVALARCLAGGAETVLMDEPLANLDPHLRDVMEAELAAFHRASGATTVYITHDQREAMALADLVAVMRDGRFAQLAPPRALYDAPADESVARFIGRGAILDAALETDGAVRLGPLRLRPRGVGAGDAPGPVRLLLRPGDLAPAPAEAPDALPATVLGAQYRGGAWEGAAAVEGLSEPLAVAAARPLAAGETLWLRPTEGWVLPRPA